jgi:hypothetical protein
MAKERNTPRYIKIAQDIYYYILFVILAIFKHPSCAS